MESFLPERLVMVDCEMTGVDETKYELLQAAFVKLELEGNRYVEVGEPLVLYFKHEGAPQNDFHKKYLTHIFEKCNESDLTGEQGNKLLEEWLGDWLGEVEPTGDCVHCDLAFLKQAGVVRRNDIIDEEQVPGTFHYEAFELNPLKAFARTIKGEKYTVSGLDTEGIHDGLVDCRNQTKELNSYVEILLPHLTPVESFHIAEAGAFKELAIEQMEAKAKEDWKHEGLELNHEIDGTTLTVLAEHKTRTIEIGGKKYPEIAGVAQFDMSGPILKPISVNVLEQYQRKGLATSLYMEAERLSGKKIAPSDHQTKMGRGLWKQEERPFGVSSKIEVTPEDAFKAFTNQSDHPSNKDLKRFEEYKWEREQFPLDQATVNGGAPISEPMWSEGYDKPRIPWSLERDEEIAKKYAANEELTEEEEKFREYWRDESVANEYAKLSTKAPPVFLIWDDEEKRYRYWNGRHRSRAAWLRGEKTIDAYVGTPIESAAVAVLAFADSIHVEPLEAVRKEIKDNGLLVDGEYGSYVDQYWVKQVEHSRTKAPERLACLRDESGKLVGYAGVGLYERLGKKSPGWKGKAPNEPWRGNLNVFVADEYRGKGVASKLAVKALEDFKTRHPEIEDVFFHPAFAKGEDLIEQVGLFPVEWGTPRARASVKKETAMRKRIKSVEVPVTDLPVEVQPAVSDDGRLPEDKRLAVEQFQRQSLRADSFQDFQILLDRIMLDAKLTEDFRPSVAGILNEYRVGQGYVAL